MHKTTFERNSSLGYSSRGLKAKKSIQTKKVYWKNGSVKSCWVIKVHYGLGENDE